MLGQMNADTAAELARWQASKQTSCSSFHAFQLLCLALYSLCRRTNIMASNPEDELACHAEDYELCQLPLAGGTLICGDKLSEYAKLILLISSAYSFAIWYGVQSCLFTYQNRQHEERNLPRDPAGGCCRRIYLRYVLLAGVICRTLQACSGCWACLVCSTPLTVKMCICSAYVHCNVHACGC